MCRGSGGADRMFYGELSLLVMKIECLGVGFGLVGAVIFSLSGDFVALLVEVEVVEDLELVVKAVVRLVWGCLGGFISCGV